MFGWIRDAIDWISDGISSAWDNTVGVVTSDAAKMVFDVIFNCIFIRLCEKISVNSKTVIKVIYWSD